MLSPPSVLDPDRLFSPFDLTQRSAVIAAVSGGSDSVAMLLLLKAWLERRHPATRIVAVTIDHGLRAASSAEAAAVGGFCSAIGVEHRVSRWIGDKPSGGLSAAARDARYELLSKAATEVGTDIVVTGHTADDQAETVAMRRARGSGRGLAGMAPATLFEGRCWIVRPLLSASRNALRAHLQGQDIAWIDDPSNDDRRFERVRVRSELSRMEGAGEALLAIAREAASFRVDLGGRAAALIDRHITMPSPGVAFVGQAFKDDSDGEAKVHALRALLAVIGGSRHFPDPERVARLFEPKRGRATLSRTVVDHRKAGMFVYREGRNLPTSAPISGRMLWDGRFRLEAAGADHLSVIAGAILAEESPKRMPVPDSVRRAGLAARPVFVAASGNPVEARPGMIVPLLAPWARFLSCLDLDLARTLARLVAAPEIPPPPLAGHNEREG